MINKRNRWFVNTVLIIAVLALVGVVILPTVDWFTSRQPAATTNPSPSGNSTPTIDPGSEEELQAQVKGYQLVLEREPNNQTALRGLLEAQLRLNDIEGAVQPLERLAQLNPEDTRYSVLLGQAKQQIGDTEGAAQTYRTILSTQPGNMDALRGLVALLLEQARPEAAIGLLQDTLTTADDVNQIQANSVDVTAVQLLLGELYVELDRDAEALAIYDESIKNSAEDFRPLLSKALLLQAQGQQDEAAALFTNAAALAPAQYRDEINRLAAAGAEPAIANDEADPNLDESDPDGTTDAELDGDTSSSTVEGTDNEETDAAVE